MKPFNIDVETLDGAVLLGTQIEIQGAMTVRPESQPLEGVHQSSLFMSLQNAAQLHHWLGNMLARAKQQGAVIQQPRR